MQTTDYLAQWQEPCPDWLINFDQESRFDAEDFFDSRVVFYPGSGDDDHAIRTFAESKAAHCFVHADYCMSRSQIESWILSGEGVFRHYRPLLSQNLAIGDVFPRGWKAHFPRHEADEFSFRSVRRFVTLHILERVGEFDGPGDRIAILFVGDDAHATYDALFCQRRRRRPPFAILLQDHGYGGNYSPFGHGGHLENIARTTSTYPELTFVGENTEAWPDYKMISDYPPDAGGMHRMMRHLYRRENIAST